MNNVRAKHLAAEMMGEKPKVNYKCKRNNPCPCGSGKKFKNCCLKASKGPQNEISNIYNNCKMD